MNICGPVARKHRRTPPNRRPIRRSHAIRLYACVANNRANRLITHIISAAATRNYSHHRRCATCNANISLLDDVLHSTSVCVCVWDTRKTYWYKWLLITIQDKQCHFPFAPDKLCRITAAHSPSHANPHTHTHMCLLAPVACHMASWTPRYSVR